MNKNRPFSLSFSSIRINAVAHEKENYLPPLRYKKKHNGNDTRGNTQSAIHL